MRLVAALVAATLLATSANADPLLTDQVGNSKHRKASAARGSAVSEPRQPVPQAQVNTGPNGNDPLYNGCDPIHKPFPSCAGAGGGG
jgi:hypothetical protein